MSQVKSCDCETCRLKVDLYERDKTNGICENMSGAFIFARKLCDIVFLRAAGALRVRVRVRVRKYMRNFFQFFL